MLEIIAMVARKPPIWLIKNACVALFENKNPVPVIRCQIYIPAPSSILPVFAIIFGKFIYTPRSSQPIGIGRKTLISETDAIKPNTKNEISALMECSENGVEWEKIILVFLISVNICFQPIYEKIDSHPKSTMRFVKLYPPKIPRRKRKKLNIHNPSAVSIIARNRSGNVLHFWEKFLKCKMLPPMAFQRKTRKIG